jgi:SPP1 gp7 family putative phage head morphogenesis protein
MQASKVKAIRAIWPNAGIRQRYQRRMVALIREMADSVEYWLQAQRRAAPPVLASDAIPADQMQDEVHRLFEQWRDRFDREAPKMANSFVRGQFSSTNAAMRMALREAGWSIEFTMTPAMRDAFEASLAENVGLIKSIPSQYLQEVEGIVMRNYAAGRDLKSMAAEIRARYHVAANRAVLISRDQSNKSSAVVQRARQQELGITQAIWMHSHAGRTPRPTHVAMNGKRYDVSKGMWDSAVQKFIWPGELISCRCQGRSVLPFTPAENRPDKVSTQSAS